MKNTLHLQFTSASGAPLLANNMLALLEECGAKASLCKTTAHPTKAHALATPQVCELVSPCHRRLFGPYN